MSAPAIEVASSALASVLDVEHLDHGGGCGGGGGDGGVGGFYGDLRGGSRGFHESSSAGGDRGDSSSTAVAIPHKRRVLASAACVRCQVARVRCVGGQPCERCVARSTACELAPQKPRGNGSRLAALRNEVGGLHSALAQLAPDAAAAAAPAAALVHLSDALLPHAAGGAVGRAQRPGRRGQLSTLANEVLTLRAQLQVMLTSAVAGAPSQPLGAREGSATTATDDAGMLQPAAKRARPSDAETSRAGRLGGNAGNIKFIDGLRHLDRIALDVLSQLHTNTDARSLGSGNSGGRESAGAGVAATVVAASAVAAAGSSGSDFTDGGLSSAQHPGGFDRMSHSSYPGVSAGVSAAVAAASAAAAARAEAAAPPASSLAVVPPPLPPLTPRGPGGRRPFLEKRPGSSAHDSELVTVKERLIDFFFDTHNLLVPMVDEVYFWRAIEELAASPDEGDDDLSGGSSNRRPQLDAPLVQTSCANFAGPSVLPAVSDVLAQQLREGRRNGEMRAARLCLHALLAYTAQVSGYCTLAGWHMRRAQTELGLAFASPSPLLVSAALLMSTTARMADDRPLARSLSSLAAARVSESGAEGVVIPCVRSIVRASHTVLAGGPQPAWPAAPALSSEAVADLAECYAFFAVQAGSGFPAVPRNATAEARFLSDARSFFPFWLDRMPAKAIAVFPRAALDAVTTAMALLLALRANDYAGVAAQAEDLVAAMRSTPLVRYSALASRSLAEAVPALVAAGYTAAVDNIRAALRLSTPHLSWATDKDICDGEVP